MEKNKRIGSKKTVTDTKGQLGERTITLMNEGYRQRNAVSMARMNESKKSSKKNDRR